jgi:arabinofuranan 3-O-arabinosyltransferase
VHGIWLRSGWIIEHVAVTILMGSLLGGVGLAGLALRDMPEKRFLLTTLGVGVLLIGVGYWVHLGSPIAHLVHEGLDGPLGPFRNVIKFEPIVELPIALGLAHILGKIPWGGLEEKLQWTGPSWSRLQQSPLSPPKLAAMGVFGLCLSLAALPMFEGEAYQQGGWKKIPSYWYQAADWLNAHGGHTNTLLIPGSDYGDFSWGYTQDEPFLPLLRIPWAVRNIIPLGSQGNTEILDEVDRILERGQPVPGFAAFLRRAGVKYLVVDNTLNRSQTQSPAPLTIRTVLAGEHDLVPVRSFGPVMASSGTISALTSSSTLSSTANEGTSLGARPLRPLEIYQVLGATSPVTVFPQADTITLTGGPQGMLALGGAHLLGNRAVFLAGDPHGFTGSQATWVVTDSQKRVQENFGELYQNHSYVLQASQMSPSLHTPPKRYQAVPGVAYQTVAVLSGAKSVTSSSYGAPITQIPGYQPLGAFEAHAGTAVWAAANDVPGQWIKIAFQHPRYVSSIALTPLDDGPWRPVVDKVEIQTSTGRVVRNLRPRQAPQRVSVIPGRTSFVKVTILSATNPLEKGSPAGPGFAHISIPGVKVVEWLKVPNDAPFSLETPGARPPIYFFSDPQPDRFSSLSPPDPEPHMHRIFYVPNPAPYAISGQVTPRAGPALLAYVAGHHRLTVKASSVYNNLPIYRPQNLIDGDVFTSWEASSANLHPWITMSWKNPTMLSSVLVEPDHSASRPAEMVISAGGQHRVLQVPRDGGLLSFKPLVTNKVKITFPKIYKLKSFDTLTKSYISIPLGISQLEFPALSSMQITAANFSAPLYVPCGKGPELEVAGHVVQTAITGTVGDLYNLRPMDFYACSPPIELSRGNQRLAALDADSPFKITSVTLRDPHEHLPSAPSRSASYVTYHAENRTVEVGPGSPGILTLAQNFNTGWKATLNGKPLKPVRVDGWEQAWLLPASRSPVLVHLSFPPGRLYELALLLGLVLAVLVVAFALFPRRWLKKASRSGNDPRMPKVHWDPKLGLDGTTGQKRSSLPKSSWASMSPWVGLMALGLLAGLLGGSLAVIALLAAGLAFFARRHRDTSLWSHAPAIAAGLSMLAAGIVTALAPAWNWTAGLGPLSYTAQILGMIALLCVLATLIPRKSEIPTTKGYARPRSPMVP